MATDTGPVPLSTHAILLRDELSGDSPLLVKIEAAPWMIRVHLGRDSLWAFVSREASAEMLAVRVAYCPGGIRGIEYAGHEGTLAWTIAGAVGRYNVALGMRDAEFSLLHWSVDFTPSVDTLVDYLPRDIYAVGADGDPASAVGNVEAAQRGLNTGLCYFRLLEPQFGTGLYVADLTALNDYFSATRTTPDAAVGGLWPEIGYLPPTPPHGPTPPTDPLAAGQRVRIADSTLVLTPDLHDDPDHSARTFLQLLGAAYGQIQRPTTQFRDWPSRAKRTLRDLQKADDATTRHYGHTYIRPYLGAEYPDVMAQVSIVTSIADYALWSGQEIPFAARFLDEAAAAIDASVGMRFELEYQANLTAWGAAACAGLWRRTGEDTYLRRGYTYLASFFHNTQMWESEIEQAVHYRNFLGETCLHDAPYMAMLESFDSFAALQQYLCDAGHDTEPAAKLLISQYCKYALDRAWFYYPDALPADIIATDIRNGRIDRKLSLPLEDLYADGQAPGQVGQEIYGAGAAFVFTSRAFHRVDAAPFTLFCDHALHDVTNSDDRSMTLVACGVDGYPATLSIVRNKRRTLAPSRLLVSGVEIAPASSSADRIDYQIPAEQAVTLTWM